MALWQAEHFALKDTGGAAEAGSPYALLSLAFPRQDTETKDLSSLMQDIETRILLPKASH